MAWDSARPNQLERLRLRHLRLLALIAETGSLSAAAARLHLSQPAATNMLRELEAAFGVVLIARSAAGSTLTAAGQMALQRLRVALAAVGHAAEAVRGEPAVPVVHIGMIPAMGVATLPRLVRALAGQGGLPRIVVREDTVPALIAELARGDIDCLIGRMDFEGEAGEVAGELHAEALWPEGFAVAAAPAHPLARKRRVDLQTLREAEWIVAPHGTRTRQVFEEYFHAAGLAAPVPRIESFSIHTNLSVAAESALLTVAPASAVAHYAGLGRVRALRLVQSFPPGATLFVRRRDTALPVLEQIAAALRELR